MVRALKSILFIYCFHCCIYCLREQYIFRALQLITHWSSAARFVAAIVVVPLSGQINEDKSTSKQYAGA